MKKLIALLLLASILLIHPGSASAHVFIPDQSGSKGTILHIIPDDDPIAGQTATLYFDAQNPSQNASSVKLVITDSEGEATTVDTKTTGTLTTADFIFPSQGVYQVTFTMTANGQTYTFTQAQRVSRGAAMSTLDKPDYAWAEIALIASGLGFLVLLIVGFNRRKDIAKQSVF